MKPYLSLLLILIVSTSTPTLAHDISHESPVPLPRRQECSSPGVVPKEWWRASPSFIRNGTTPYAKDKDYQYYRDVAAFGADPTGRNSSSEAINRAVSSGNRTNNTVTTLPAYVSLPPGTYLVTSPIQLLVATYLVGSPAPFEPTILKAAPELGTEPVILGYDPYQGEGSANKNFYIALRNVVIDTTAIPGETPARAIEWSVSQGSSLTNVKIFMPKGEGVVRHRGITMDFGGGSGKIMSEVEVEGGGVGIEVNNQQYTIKGLRVKDSEVGVRVKRGYIISVMGGVFEGCGIGLDLRGGDWHKGEVVGGVSVVDTVMRGCEVGVVVREKGQGVVLDGVEVGEGAVAVRIGERGEVLLTGGVRREEVWVMGNGSPNGPQQGSTYPFSRPPSLLTTSGAYQTKPLPQYTSFIPSQIINIKSDPSHPVHGDNTHDDGPSINAILARASAGCNKVVFFPQGIYLTRSTITIPPNTRIVGEVLSTISGTGPLFSDSAAPRPVVHITSPNNSVSGTVEISDILISVRGVSPGAILLQISHSSAALWSVVLRAGGSIDTTVTTSCSDPDPSNCMATHTLLHMAENASDVYVEDVWGWVADHALDVVPNVPAQNIAVGRGLTISDNSGPVWLVGTSFEHCVLYQYGVLNSKNVLVVGQQTESPYWQGQGTELRAPGPWAGDVGLDWGHCEKQGRGEDDRCYRAWGVYLSGGEDITIHGSALWAFFNGMDDNLWKDPQCEETGGVCQTNMVYVKGGKGVRWFSMGSKNTENLVYRDSEQVSFVRQSDVPGGWGGLLAVYLADLGEASEGGDDSGGRRVTVGGMALGVAGLFALRILM
ncbi:family 55 putative glycoside hydrolase [Triangularia setosa]|uniref:Family 55 putative glycoside hydrolase n=1 Tax=Triangularia setosa TaxID=2587417 RepID=A0AAN7A9X6_9PEZI|nr:family 55 putative glycoside hydrolase [Podospora setosa]